MSASDRLGNWDEIQHRPLSEPPTNFDGLSRDDIVDEVVRWFLENFEDPAETTPYESAEGGYQFIWGGPYEARDILNDIFEDILSEEIIEAIAKKLDARVVDWVPSSNRRLPPEDFDLEPTLTASEHRELLLGEIAKLEALLEAIPAAPVGIGHNGPPEPTTPEILTAVDKADILKASATLKTQAETPTDNGKAVIEAAEVLDAKASALKTALLTHGNSFVAEAVKAGGKSFGTIVGGAAGTAVVGAASVLGAGVGIVLGAGVGAGIAGLRLLADQLAAVSSAALKWLAALGLNAPF